MKILILLSAFAVLAQGEYDESFKCKACTKVGNYIIPIIREAGNDAVDNVCDSFESDTFRSACGQVVGTGWSMIVNWVKYRKAGARDICVSLNFCENGGRDLAGETDEHGTGPEGRHNGDDGETGNNGRSGSNSRDGEDRNRGSDRDSENRGSVAKSTGSNDDLTFEGHGGRPEGRHSTDDDTNDDDERAKQAEHEREAEGRGKRSAVLRYREHMAKLRQ